jgi:hypothetical protein
MAINGGAFTQDFRTQLRKFSDGTTRVGEEGRLWYNNSDQTLRVSDGSTAGGVVINSGGGGGSSITIQDEGSSLSTAATTINFVGSGVTASGTGATKTITISGGGGGVSDIVDDTSPQLGGDLDINSNDITGTGSVNITGTVTAQSALNAQTGTTYTTVIADASKLVTLTNGSAITLTIPPNSAVAYAVGTKLDFAQLGAGQVTFAQGSGVTINSTPTKKIRAQYGAATCIKTATNVWLLVGDLAAS